MDTEVDTRATEDSQSSHPTGAEDSTGGDTPQGAAPEAETTNATAQPNGRLGRALDSAVRTVRAVGASVPWGPLAAISLIIVDAYCTFSPKTHKIEVKPYTPKPYKGKRHALKPYTGSATRSTAHAYDPDLAASLICVPTATGAKCSIMKGNSFDDPVPSELLRKTDPESTVYRTHYTLTEAEKSLSADASGQIKSFELIGDEWVDLKHHFFSVPGQTQQLVRV